MVRGGGGANCGVRVVAGLLLLTFCSKLNSFSLGPGELTLDLAKSLKLLERWRESWGDGEA